MIENEKGIRQQVFEYLPTLDEYLDKNSEGYLYVSEEAKLYVPLDVLDEFVNGIELLNFTAEEGLISFDENRSFIIHESALRLNDLNLIQPLGLSLTNYTFTYNYSEARNLQYRLEDYSSTWAVVATLMTGVSAGTFNPTAIDATAAAAIMSVDNDWVANRIDRNITSRGVTIRVQWLPYPAVLIRGR